MDELLGQVTAAAQEVRTGEQAERRAAALNQQIAAEQRSIDELAERLTHEERDVTRLEGVSLSRVLAGLRGRREDELDKERAERDAVRLELATRTSALERLRREAEAARTTAACLPAARDRLGRALTARETAIESAGTPGAGELLSLAQRRGTLLADVREIDEASAAAEQAQVALARVADSLSSAQGWSTYDTFFGGGMVASMVKHDRLDQAAEAAEAAQHALQVLAAELRDIGAEARVQLAEVGVGLRFADVFFDGMFSDWMVAGRIRASQESVAATGRTVGELQQRLYARRQEATGEVDACDRRRFELLSR